MKKPFETERLILREIELSDAQDMYELDSDPDVLKFIGIPTVKSIDESIQVIKNLRLQYKENGIGRWAVIDKVTNEFLGWSGLKFYREKINNRINFYEHGYRFKKKYWGEGYATETSKAWVKYGFEVLKTNDIYAMTELEHHVSKHVLQKVGFENVEIFDYFGEDLDWFRINKKNWKDD